MPGERQRLSRDRVLGAAVALADAEGLGALSMRRLATELGVVPMALYKHVADKEELLDGMVGVVLGEIPERARDDRKGARADALQRPPAEGSGPLPSPGEPSEWRSTVRTRILDARRVHLAHPWLRRVLETRSTRTPAVLAHTEALIGAFRAGGFSDPLTHHVMHALGSRSWGFTQDLFEDANTPQASPEQWDLLARSFPNIAAVARTAVHDDGTVVARGCDDQFEFEFALDLLLDGFARLHARGWLPPSD